MQGCRVTDASDIDPELQNFLSEMRAGWAQHPPFDSLSFPQQRAVAEQVRARWTLGGPVMASTQDHMVRTTAGELGIRVYIPTTAPRPAPALVYLHGGGYTLFSIATHDRLMREYADVGGFAVIGIDYPLAPEIKYPVALDRIEAFMLWLKDNAEEWNIDPDRLAMGGDSAGGNLSFATTLRLRDRGEPGLVKAILSNYGAFTTEISDQAEARFGGPGSIMDRGEARQYWANYLRDTRDETDPFACPIHADLTEFPPVFLVVPELDIVAEQSIAMHDRLREAGVPVSSRIYPGAIHSFLEAMSISSLARTAIADGADFICKYINGSHHET
ncbi:MAG: acetylesterase [Sphingomonadales bacterium]|nr:acetylesterase [Sphingomonadales bacterium]